MACINVFFIYFSGSSSWISSPTHQVAYLLKDRTKVRRTSQRWQAKQRVSRLKLNLRHIFTQQTKRGCVTNTPNGEDAHPYKYYNFPISNRQTRHFSQWDESARGGVSAHGKVSPPWSFLRRQSSYMWQYACSLCMPLLNWMVSWLSKTYIEMIESARVKCADCIYYSGYYVSYSV